MKLFLILCAFLFWVSHAQASTKALFSTDKVAIIVQGRSGDMDAPNLFNAMTIAAIDSGGHLEKQLEIKDTAGTPLLSIACRIAKTIANYGSCTTTVYKTKFADFDRSKHYILLALNLPESAVAAQAFKHDINGHVFLSEDSRFGLELDLSSTGTPDSFRLFYK